MPSDGPRQDWRTGGPPPPPQTPPPSARPPSTPPPPVPPPTAPPPAAPPPAGGGWSSPGAGPGQGAGPGTLGRFLPLHPLTVGDVLDGSFRALRATFAPAALVVLLVYGPYQLLSALVVTRALPELLDPVTVERMVTDATFDVGVATRAMAYGGGTAIVGLLVQVLVGAALVWLALRADRGEETSPGAALRASAACSGATLGGSVLVGLTGLGLGVGVLVVVSLLFAIAAPLGVLAIVVVVPVAVIAAAALYGAYLIVLPVAVAEGAGALTTFRRAAWVVRRRFWRVVGIVLLLMLVIVAVSLGFSAGLAAVAELAGSFGWVVDGLSATATALVTVPVTVFVALLLYLDARVRLEGYDLEIRARGLGPS